MRVESVGSVERVDSIIVEHSDTLREVTTITVQLNDTGDTLKISTVTDRTTVRDHDRTQYRTESVEVRVDTVYVEKDSLRLTAYSLPDVTQKSRKAQKLKPSGFVSALRWVFWILVAIIVLILLVRVKH